MSERFISGSGVFVSNATGGMDPKPAWRASIVALSAAVARTTGPRAQVWYRAYRPRNVALDVTGPGGSVYMTVAVNPRGDPCVLDDRDLPSLNIGELESGAELEFWMANEADTFCLAAHLAVAIDQASNASSSLGASTIAVSGR